MHTRLPRHWNNAIAMMVLFLLLFDSFFCWLFSGIEKRAAYALFRSTFSNVIKFDFIFIYFFGVGKKRQSCALDGIFIWKSNISSSRQSEAAAHWKWTSKKWAQTQNRECSILNEMRLFEWTLRPCYFKEHTFSDWKFVSSFVFALGYTIGGMSMFAWYSSHQYSLGSLTNANKIHIDLSHTDCNRIGSMTEISVRFKLRRRLMLVLLESIPSTFSLAKAFSVATNTRNKENEMNEDRHKLKKMQETTWLKVL